TDLSSHHFDLRQRPVRPVDQRVRHLGKLFQLAVQDKESRGDPNDEQRVDQDHDRQRPHCAAAHLVSSLSDRPPDSTASLTEQAMPSDPTPDFSAADALPERLVVFLSYPIYPTRPRLTPAPG